MSDRGGVTGGETLQGSDSRKTLETSRLKSTPDSLYRRILHLMYTWNALIDDWASLQLPALHDAPHWGIKGPYIRGRRGKV